MGRFQLGNTAALKHGRHSARVKAGQLPELADAAAALPEAVSAILADLGGAEAVSALARDEVERYARLRLVADFLWHQLQTSGPLSARGRTRASLSAFLAVNDRLHRVASTLGLERRAKPVHASPREWLESLVDDESNDQPDDATDDSTNPELQTSAQPKE